MDAYQRKQIAIRLMKDAQGTHKPEKQNDEDEHLGGKCLLEGIDKVGKKKRSSLR